MREAAAFINENYQPLAGVVFAGSIIRGNGDRHSDIDTYVIFEGTYRQRLHRLYNGVRFEIFVNPPRQIRQYFQAEQRSGGGFTLHMLATGHIAWQKNDIVDALRQDAQQILDNGPRYSAEALTMERYLIIDKLENALDLRFRDPAMGYIMLMEAVSSMLMYDFKQHDKWTPRSKDLLAILRRDRPEIARLVHAINRQSTDKRFDSGIQLADRILGTYTFFESESTKDPLEPKTDSTE
jgi:hypothetical protein